MPERTDPSIATLTYVVPARNEERLIAACIAALRAQEVGRGIEILVIDNGSIDATAADARAAGARVIHEPRAGLANARRAGLEAASGDLLVFVDADTRLPRNWTRHVVAAFEADPRLVALSPGFTFYDGRVFDNVGAFLFRSLLCPLTDAALRRMGRPGVLIGSAMAVRTEALRRVGGIAPEFQFYGEDTALAYRMHAHGRVQFAREPRYATSARRYQRCGILQVVFRYFSVFALIHLGMARRAEQLARRFHDADVRQGGADILIGEAGPSSSVDRASAF